MESPKETPSYLSSTQEHLMNRQITDPLVLSIAAGVLGFVLGSGQLFLLRQKGGKVLLSLGQLAVFHVYESFRKKNPNLFNEASRVTH